MKSAKNSLRERRYNIGDMYVVDVVIRRRTELVCSAASVLSFRSDPYSELLKESQQVVWLATCKKIEMGPAAAADDLSQTIMADDGVLERVGKKEEQPKEPSLPRVRSKRKMESCPFCVRSFTDKENLKEHMRSDHFDS